MRSFRRSSVVILRGCCGALGLALLIGLSGCKRPGATNDEAAGEQPAADGVVEKASHLAPLIGKPWIGHATDGTLVKIEFFEAKDRSTTAVRSSFVAFDGRGRAEKSAFVASPDLATINWENGMGTASYSAEDRTLDATVVSNLGTHRARLQQVTAETHPELATFRKSIAADEATIAAHQKIVEMLVSGKRWWKSDPGWDSVATLEEDIEADEAGRVALIRPAGVKPIKLPPPDPGGSFELPLKCHVVPGIDIPGDRPAVGVFSELHSDAGAQSAWGLAALNPGASTQEISAQWRSSPDEPAPGGSATLLVYLTSVTSAADGTRSFEFTKPVSNLLEIQIEFTTEPEHTE